jgi:protein transport protein SEC24
LFSLFQDGR